MKCHAAMLIWEDNQVRSPADQSTKKIANTWIPGKQKVTHINTQLKIESLLAERLRKITYDTNPY